MLLGVASRFVDTAAWAPPWIGLVFAPWLAAAWLAGATTVDRRAGALRGAVLLGATAAAYLVTAALLASPDEAARMAPGLVIVALVAGPFFGVAGAIRRAPWPGSLVGAAVLGAALVSDGIVLQFGERLPVERALFAAELLAGLWLAARVARHPRGAALALVIGLVLASFEVGVVAVLGMRLP